MKLNKLFFGLLGLAAFTFAACSDDDDDDYTPASVSGPQVYFSNKSASEYEISPSATSFQVPILRANNSGELTVPLDVTITEGSIFSAPSAVTFNDGENEAQISIAYDPASIEYGRYDTISIAIADAQFTTPYGNSSLTFKAGVTDWGEWQPWNEAGTANYIYCGLFFTGEDPNLDFTYRHNMIRTNLYQFRLNHWGYDVDLVLDYDDETGRVTIAKTFTGYTHTSYGDEFIADWNTFLAESGEAPTEDGYGTFDKEQGIFAIPIMYFDDEPWDDVPYMEYIYINGYTRADYSSGVSYGGLFIGAEGSTQFVANVTLGSDVTLANVALVNGATVSDEELEQIIDGTFEGIEQITASAAVNFDAEGAEYGYYTLVVVPFDAEGEALVDEASVAN